MISLLRADLYRLVHEKSLWICLILCVLCGIGMTAIGLVSLLSMDPTGAEDVVGQLRNGVALADLQGDEMTVEMVRAGYGSFLSSISMSVNLLFLPFFVSLVVISHCSDDFETGFIKNLLSSQRSRRTYYGEKILLIVMLGLGFVLITTGAVVLFRAVLDLFYTSMEPFPEIIAWLVLNWLICSAYALLCAIIFWLTRSKILGILSATLISTGILMSIITGALQGTVPADVMAAVQSWTLSGVGAFLNHATDGIFTTVYEGGTLYQALLTLALWYAAMIVVTLTACKRKDI